MEPITVEVDTYELRSSVPDELRRLGFNLVVHRLATGDCDVGSGTLVERKTAIDLVLSLESGRLWRQLGELRRASAFPVLILEGDPAKMLGAEVRRGLVLAIVDQGIVVLGGDGPVDTARWVAAIARRRRSSKPRDRPPYTYRGRLPRARPGERLLCAIPGISVHHARALLDTFGSVQAIVEAAREDWLEVPGIGPVRAAATTECFGCRKPH